jgi:glycosyltransferase involved in cell wall biosynthesis
MAYFTAVRLHRMHTFSGVWAMMAAFAGFSALFFKLRYPRVPYLLTLQEGDPIPHILSKVRFVKPLFVRIFTEADIVQTISMYLGVWARSMGFTKQLEVIPNAVDTAHFSHAYPDEELAALRTALGKKPGDIFLITTSRLVTKNACDDVIRALALLPPTAHFLILGDGPDKDMLSALAIKEGVSDRTHFVGQVDHRDMPRYLQVSDIFVRPSRSEGMGNSFVEAMAAGLPVIATQEGGIADFLFDAKRNGDHTPTGFAVDKNSPEQIKEAVERILGDREGTKRVVSNARSMVFEKYDWHLIAHEMHTRVFAPLLAQSESTNKPQ